MVERTSYQQGAPAWVDLTTSDLAGACRFYGGLLGWEFDVDPDPVSGNYTQCLVRGKRVAGINGHPPLDTPTHWLPHFAVEDVDKAAHRVMELGGALEMPPMNVTDAGRQAIGVDPAGAVFGLWRGRQHGGAELTGEVGTLTWAELLTTGWDDGFYPGVLGAAVTEDAAGPGRRILRAEQQPVAGVTQSDPDWTGGTARWLVVFGVADLDAAVARAGELGGPVLAEPADRPYGRVAVLADPQGGAFGVTAVG